MSSGRRRFFISYAHEDAPLLAKFVQDIEKAEHEVFFDERIPIGSTWADEIERQLQACDFFLLLLSEHALRSEMVLQEVERVRERRKAGASPLILVVRVNLEGDLPYRWAAYLGAYQCRAWHEDADFQPILTEILEVADSGRELVAATATIGQAWTEDFSCPEPSVDLRSVVAPGGALAPQDPFYIERSSDKEAMEYADRVGETMVVKAARQMGKSSLLKRYLLRCQRAGKRTALLDLSILSDYDLRDYSSFLSCLARDMLDKLRLALDPPQIRSNYDLMLFVQGKLLAAIQEPIVLAFDEVDRVLNQPYATSFFSMLRYWHERRTDPAQEHWARLELALVISTEPYLLIDDVMQSPFNIRVPIELPCFTRAECIDLNARYGGMLSREDVIKLHHLLGGQPYLLRVAYHHLRRTNGRTVADLERTIGADGGPFRDHLKYLLTRLRRQNLLVIMQQVIAHGTAPAGAWELLEGAGLIRREAGRLVTANRLYHDFFRTPA